jgi:CRP/FNR family transcriptional regulator, anaerobic regulatory protein
MVMNGWSRIEYGTPAVDPAVVLGTFAVRTATPANHNAARREVETLLRGLGQQMNYRSGEEIFSAGGNAHAVYRVNSGAVVLWRKLPNGKRRIVDFRLPGEFFGVVHRPTETSNAEASSDSIITTYRRGYVDGICDAVPSFRRSITLLTDEPPVPCIKAELADGRTAKERIAELLLDTARRAAEAGEITLRFSDGDIADRVGAPRQLVTNGLRDLETSGAIMRTGEGGLMVLDAGLLQSQI